MQPKKGIVVAVKQRTGTVSNVLLGKGLDVDEKDLYMYANTNMCGGRCSRPKEKLEVHEMDLCGCVCANTHV